MARRARRSAGPGRRFILVAWSFKSIRRPLDMKAGHERPHKDRRLGSCDTHVSGAMVEMASSEQRSAGLGRQLILVARSLEDPIDPSMSKLATSDPTRTAESGHVTAMSPMRSER